LTTTGEIRFKSTLSAITSRKWSHLVVDGLSKSVRENSANAFLHEVSSVIDISLPFHADS
jgi:hypothetical protein